MGHTQMVPGFMSGCCIKICNMKISPTEKHNKTKQKQQTNANPTSLFISAKTSRWLSTFMLRYTQKTTTSSDALQSWMCPYLGICMYLFISTNHNYLIHVPQSLISNTYLHVYQVYRVSCAWLVFPFTLFFFSSSHLCIYLLYQLNRFWKSFF